MTMMKLSHNPTNVEPPFDPQIEITTMEVFLDFDPVFPGWPPDKADDAETD